MAQRMYQVLGVALAGVLAGACATGPGGAMTQDGAGVLETVVEVTNNNWMDVTVYAVRSGKPARLGTVTSTSTERFALPRRLVVGGTIQLIAAPVGSRGSHQTDHIMVDRGDRIVWNVENALALSSYTVHRAVVH
jgi:hypothetical protein